MTETKPADVLAFWKAAGPERWWKRDAAFDEQVRERFGATHVAAARGALEHWSETPDGALALVILLDQFSRNLFRDDARAFAHDDYARRVAEAAIARGDDAKVDPALRQFFYLPFMHSEKLADQDRCVTLFAALDDAPENLKFAEIHRDVIARFGRFPHRNKALGRRTTAEEQAFLDSGGFAG